MNRSQKILIVDDDKDVHAILKIVLEKAGFQVFSALDAMQGTMMARQVLPDLLVLDIMMPAGGGVAVYTRFRQLVATIHIPVLVYSAMPREQIENLIPQSLNTVIMTKPALPSEVVNAVEKLLE